MSILDEVYMSGGSDVVLHCLELSSEAWFEKIILVDDWFEHEFKTETGETILAKPSGMSVALPKRDASGAQSLMFALDGVRGEATRLLRDAIVKSEPIRIVLRIYLESNKKQPAENPYNFLVKEFKASKQQIQITAGFFEFIDMKWPRVIYDAETAPCLKYL